MKIFQEMGEVAPEGQVRRPKSEVVTFTRSWLINMKYHYTTAALLAKIIESGEIRPATDYVPQGVRPAVWVSTHVLWEPTATKAIYENGSIRSLTFNEMLAVGIARIAVRDDAAPHNWEHYKRTSGDSRKMLRGLYQSALAVGARPSDWFCSFDPIHADKWIAIEEFRKGKWKPNEIEMVEAVA